MESNDGSRNLALERERKSQVKIEAEYSAEVIEYALQGGWIKEAQLPLLREKYLQPIHRKYLEIIEEIKADNPPVLELQEAIRFLNFCLESTRRIGSTDANNILRSVADYRRQARSEYADYAVTAMQDCLNTILGA